MNDLAQELGAWRTGRLAVVGLGNAERTDDGLGLQFLDRLAQWAAEGNPAAKAMTLVHAGTRLEGRLHELTAGRFDRVLLVDATELGAAAGSVVWLDRVALKSWLPQISTHRISLSLAAELIAAGGVTQVALLGVQPGSLRPGRELTDEVRATVDLLAAWLVGGDSGQGEPVTAEEGERGEGSSTDGAQRGARGKEDPAAPWDREREERGRGGTRPYPVQGEPPCSVNTLWDYEPCSGRARPSRTAGPAQLNAQVRLGGDAEPYRTGPVQGEVIAG